MQYSLPLGAFKRVFRISIMQALELLKAFAIAILFPFIVVAYVLKRAFKYLSKRFL